MHFEGIEEQVLFLVVFYYFCDINLAVVNCVVSEKG